MWIPEKPKPPGLRRPPNTNIPPIEAAPAKSASSIAASASSVKRRLSSNSGDRKEAEENFDDKLDIEHSEEGETKVASDITETTKDQTGYADSIEEATTVIKKQRRLRKIDPSEDEGEIKPVRRDSEDKGESKEAKDKVERVSLASSSSSSSGSDNLVIDRERIKKNFIRKDEFLVNKKNESVLYY